MLSVYAETSDQLFAFSSCHSVLTRRRIATMLEGTQAGRKRNSDPTPTGKTSQSSSTNQYQFLLLLYLLLSCSVQWSSSCRDPGHSLYKPWGQHYQLHSTAAASFPVHCLSLAKERLLHHCTIQWWNPSLLMHAPNKVVNVLFLHAVPLFIGE